MATIELEATSATWRELDRHSDVNAVIDAAVARLEGVVREVTVQASGLSIVTDDETEPLDAIGRKLARLVSNEPYLVNGKYVFLPLFHDCLPAMALAWERSLGASRLVQLQLPGRLGEVSLTRHGSDIQIERNTESDDIVVLYGGAPLHHARIVTMPQLLYVTRRSDPSYQLEYVLFRDPLDVIWFGESLLLDTNHEGGGQETWTRTALEAAALRKSRFSLMLVDRAAGERRDLVAALPTNVLRTVAYSSDLLLIAAEGDEDDLVVHSDQLREHLANPTVTIVDAIAAPGETPSALYLRLKAQLGR